MNEKLGEYLSYTLQIITFIVYFILLFVLEDIPALRFLNYLGFVFLIIGITLLVLSLRSHLRKGEHVVFDRGVYGIVRHPMYVGAVLLFIAMALFLPVWVMILLAIINVVVIYRFMVMEEQKNIEKFGDAYQSYMMQVPRVNLIGGLIRFIQRR